MNGYLYWTRLMGAAFSKPKFERNNLAFCKHEYLVAGCRSSMARLIRAPTTRSYRGDVR